MESESRTTGSNHESLVLEVPRDEEATHELAPAQIKSFFNRLLSPSCVFNPKAYKYRVNSSDQKHQARAIVLRALAYSEDQREAWLLEECAGDGVLIAAVHAMLEKEEQATLTGEGLDIQSGSRIGPYTLRRSIGEGGFAEVFLAEQEEPVRRRVALKFLKPGMDSKELLARFEVERQALALMQHPGIAKILDAGITGNGRSWFAMEYVDGVPLTKYCDTHRLNLRERIELFSEVCEAVQHAHQKGIIHRDLKPSNILVGLSEGKPRAKVIDFGIAKALGPRLTEQTLFTSQEMLIGTPAYMSPEQADVGGADIDTRSDIYSLGILLYELLSGEPPFHPRRLQKAGYREIQRILREEEPQRPSTKSTTIEEAGKVAEARRLNVTTLRRRLNGDLDWIAMKALEKDRTRRYSTVQELSADLGRHLACDPVTAGPPSVSYRFAKFVRRNRVGVTAAAMVLLALAAGMATTTSQWLQARKAEQEARKAEQLAITEQEKARAAEKVAVAERDNADRERARTMDIVEWNEDALMALDIRQMGQTLIQLLRESIAEDLTSSGITPEEVELAIEQFWALAVRADTADVARNLLYEEFITTLIKNLESKFSKDPLTKANLRGGLADTCLKLGMLEEAYQLNLSRYEALSALPKENGMRIVATSDLAAVLSFMGKYTEAQNFYLEALEGIRISNKTQGEENFIFIGGILNSLGQNSYFLGKADEAETYYLEGLEADPQNYGALKNMGDLRLDQDRQSEAENFYMEALKVCRRVEGNESPERLDIISALGRVFRNQGKFDEADQHHQELFEYYRQRFGNGHVNTINHLQEIGHLREAEGKLDQAELIYRDCLKRRFNSDSPLIFETFKNLYYLANNLHNQGKHDTAQKFDQQLLEMSERLDIPNHGELSTEALIKIGSKQTEPKRAEIFFKKAIVLARSYYGEKHKSTSDAIFGMGTALADQGKYREAEGCFQETLRIRRQVFGKEHAGTAIAIGYLGGILEKLGKIDEAERCYREYLEVNRGLYGDEHFQTLGGLRNLGELLKNHGRLEEAQVFLQEIITLVARRPEHVAKLWPDLVKSLAPLKKLEEKLDIFGDPFGNSYPQDSGGECPFNPE